MRVDGSDGVESSGADGGIAVADELGDEGESFGDGEGIGAVLGEEATELLCGFGANPGVLGDEAVLENGGEDLGEGVNPTDLLEDGANAVANRLLGVANLQCESKVSG